MAHRTLTASVSHLFLLLAKPSGSLPWPSDLPFHLGSHTRSRQGTSSSLPAPGASLFSLSTLSWSLPVVAAESEAVPQHQGARLSPAWPHSCRSVRACLLLTCVHPDLWVLECWHAHVAKESNLLEALGLQIVRTQGGFLTLALCQLHGFRNCHPHPST